MNMDEFAHPQGEYSKKAQRDRVLKRMMANNPPSPFAMKVVEDFMSEKSELERQRAGATLAPSAPTHEQVDALLAVLRKHGVTDFRGHGIDVRLTPAIPAPAPETTIMRYNIKDNGRPYVPAHVAPDAPEPTKVVEHQQIDVEAALFGAK